RVYTKNRLVKLEFAVGKGKRRIDKRETIKKREARKDIGRAMRSK
ncbi:MAG: SsrA-binding protein, partial [Candidatus Moranbacteria bacterium]|nr:SsrA-binding protein [Candidatus Moranbacteria bacterium]